MKQSCVAGVDPSITNTGVVVLDADNGRLLCAFDGRKGCAGLKTKNDIARYVAQTKFIGAWLSEYEIRKVAYEDYSFGSTHRAYSLAEFGGILKARLNELCMDGITLVAPTQNKKFACGDYLASKVKMRESALAECSELGGSPSFDICDAYFLALFAWYRENPKAAARLHSGNRHLRMRLEMTRKNDDRRK